MVMIFRVLIVWLSTGTLLASSPAAAQSFDCRKATTAVERMICADAELSTLDEQMAQAFTDARQHVETSVIGQLAWLKNVRNRCAHVECLKDAYQKRIAHLDTLSPVVRADGYAFREHATFSPGIYEAVVDAKVYSDIDETAAHERLRIKKGTRINVYSAGHHGGTPPSTDWMQLGGDCNGKILAWDTFGWIGTLSKDFRRVGDLAVPIYEKGVITNCAATNSGAQTLPDDEPCSDMKTSTDKLAEMLSISAGSAAIKGGTFSVKRTNGTTANAAKFEMAYVVSGKTIATASVVKGSPVWAEFSYLELEGRRGNLAVRWSSGGSGCCVCDYTITAGARGFITVDSGTSPTYKAEK
jgi:uncharacterized protein